MSEDQKEVRPLVKRAPKSDEEKFVEMLARLSPEMKEKAKSALGVKESVIKKKKRGPTNADVKRFSAMYGDVYYPDGAKWHPSESLEAKGPQAVQEAYEKWLAGQDIDPSDADPLESLAATAHM